MQPSNALVSASALATVSADDGEQFDALVKLAALTITDNSKRVYLHTYGLWADWCSNNDVSPLAFLSIPAFLSSMEVTRRTRKRQMSTMRKLVSIAAIANPSRFQQIAAFMREIKMPEDGLGTNERDKRALSPSEVHRILIAWEGDGNTALRNRALTATLFLTGMRRADAATLQWRDVDLDEGIIHLRHAKGGKEGDISITGDMGIAALSAWRDRVTANGERMYVFCRIRRGDHIDADAPLGRSSINYIVDKTEAVTGIKFTPHTARRTLITEALATGTPMKDVQAQALHSQESTTLLYAQAVDAKERRKRFKLRYG